MRLLWRGSVKTLMGRCEGMFSAIKLFYGKIKLYIIGGLAILTAVFWALLNRSKRKRAEDKLKNAEAVIEAEHESNALLSDRLGEEQKEVKSETDNPDIDYFSK